MANSNIEKYLEAILAAIAGGEVGDVPVPSWNIEKYLAAILGAVGGMSPSMESNEDGTFPPNVINLYDDDAGDLPDYVSYDENEGTYAFNDSYNAYETYQRLLRGEPVWIRMHDNRDHWSLVVAWNVYQGTLRCFDSSYENAFIFTNFAEPEEDFGGGSITPVRPNTGL